MPFAFEKLVVYQKEVDFADQAAAVALSMSERTTTRRG
jgi:hypothetical protein